MKIKTEIGIHILSMRYFNGLNLEPDCLSELDEPFIANHKYDPVNDCTLATEAEVNGLIDFWEHELKQVNSGNEGEVLNALDYGQIERGEGWQLIEE